MSTFESSYIILRNPQSELLYTPVQGALPSVSNNDWQGAVMRLPPEGLTRRFAAFWRKCWETMMNMYAAYEFADSQIGDRSRERSAERRRDEQAWSRLDDDGCPPVGTPQRPSIARPIRDMPDLVKAA